jgi:hypothetical protein
MSFALEDFIALLVAGAVYLAALAVYNSRSPKARR